MGQTSYVPPKPNILATRRALLGDPINPQVQAWLQPIYRGPIGSKRGSASKAVPDIVNTIKSMVSTLSPVVKAGSPLGNAYNDVAEFVSAPLNSHYAEAFAAVRRPASSVFGTFVSLVYARAVVLLASSTLEGPALLNDLKQHMANPTASIEAYRKTQKSLDSNFVGHLTAMAEVEAQIDPHFERVLARGAKLFQEHKPAHQAQNPLSDAGSGLDLLSHAHSSTWWHAPAILTFAMSVGAN